MIELLLCMAALIVCAGLFVALAGSALRDRDDVRPNAYEDPEELLELETLTEQRFPLKPGDHIRVTSNTFRWNHERAEYEETRYTELMRVTCADVQGVSLIWIQGKVGGSLHLPWSAWDMETNWYRVTYFHPHPDERFRVPRGAP